MARFFEGGGGGWDAPPHQRGFGPPQRAPWWERGRGGEGRGSGWTGPSPRGGDRVFGETVYGPERYGLGPYHERLRRRRRPDDELKRDIEEALFFDTWVDADAITIEVRDGVVTLTGTLPNFDEIRYATDDVWDIEGVLGVHSDLTVRE